MNQHCIWTFLDKLAVGFRAALKLSENEEGSSGRYRAAHSDRDEVRFPERDGRKEESRDELVERHEGDGGHRHDCEAQDHASARRGCRASCSISMRDAMKHRVPRKIRTPWKGASYPYISMQKAYPGRGVAPRA